jgi:hypothetical protein
MDKINRFYSREVRGVIHNEAVAISLQLHPYCWFETDVASNAVEEHPCVGDVARINIHANFVAILG